MASEKREKRVAPEDIQPLVHDGVSYSVHYVAADGGTYHGAGHIKATDVQTNRTLWDVELFPDQRTSAALEGDVQDVYITKLSVEDEQLIVTDENNQMYRLDLSTGRLPLLDKP